MEIESKTTIIKVEGEGDNRGKKGKGYIKEHE